MIIKEQIIEKVWTYANRKEFVNKGYEFTNWGDTFYVKLEDLETNSSTKIKYICDYCGSLNETQYRLYTQGYNLYPKSACPRCTTKKSNEINKEKRINQMWDKITDKANRFGYKLVSTKEEYVNQNTRIKYICYKHGLKDMSVNNFVKKYGCPDCRNEKVGELNRLTIGQVIEIIESVNNNILLNPNDYCGNMKRNLYVQCGCGNTFFTSIAKYPKKYRCSQCAKSESLGENKIRTYLENNCINFIQQHKFQDCKDILPLPFDFYLSDYNICIEFDGEQHFRPAFGEESFQKTVLHDNIKNNYCKENDIPLIRISYKDMDNIEQILNEKITELCKRYSLVS